MDPIQEETYKGHVIKIYCDEDPTNPREWDNLGTMVCWHSRYNLGDEQRNDELEEFFKELCSAADPEFDDRVEYWENGQGYSTLAKTHEKPWIEAGKKIENLIDKCLRKHYIMLPLYLYDHGGITMRTGAFSCPWDSGQVGWIYVSKDRAKKEYNWKTLNKKRIQKVKDCLRGEVETYDKYLTNSFVGYVIEDSEENEVESCWGFDDLDFCIKEAQAIINYKAENTLQKYNQIRGDK